MRYIMCHRATDIVKNRARLNKIQIGIGYLAGILNRKIAHGKTMLDNSLAATCVLQKTRKFIQRKFFGYQDKTPKMYCKICRQSVKLAQILFNPLHAAP